MQVPRYLQFYIENHEQIKAAEELSEMARKRLPEFICRALGEAIKLNAGKWKWSPAGKANIVTEVNADQVLWWHPGWIETSGAGAYFGVFPIAQHSIIDATEKNEQPFLYFYYDGRGRGRLDKKKLRDALGKMAKIPRGFEFGPPAGIEDDLYIVTQPLEGMLSIDKLDPDLTAMQKKFIARAKVFTEAIAPIVCGLVDKVAFK